MADMEKIIRIHAGAAAVRAGSLDCGQNDIQTDLSDALANMMHYAHDHMLDFQAALDNAARNFEEER